MSAPGCWCCAVTFTAANTTRMAWKQDDSGLPLFCDDCGSVADELVEEEPRWNFASLMYAIDTVKWRRAARQPSTKKKRSAAKNQPAAQQGGAR